MTPENDLPHEAMPGRRPQSWGTSLVTVSIAVVSLIAGGFAGGLVLQQQNRQQEQPADPADPLQPSASQQASAPPPGARDLADVWRWSGGAG